MEVFEAVAQPKRREILRLLSGGELSAGDIASRFDVTQPAISQHLKVLKDAGLVSERRAGTKRMLSVRAEGLAELHDFLAEVLPARLDRLKEVAERKERAERDGRRAKQNRGPRRARGPRGGEPGKRVRVLHRPGEDGRVDGHRGDARSSSPRRLPDQP